jgi:hypothetical protein
MHRVRFLEQLAALEDARRTRRGPQPNDHRPSRGRTVDQIVVVPFSFG